MNSVMNILDFCCLILSSTIFTHNLLILLSVTPLDVLLSNFLTVLVLIIIFFKSHVMRYIGKPKRILPSDISNGVMT